MGELPCFMRCDRLASHACHGPFPMPWPPDISEPFRANFRGGLSSGRQSVVVGLRIQKAKFWSRLQGAIAILEVWDPRTLSRDHYAGRRLARIGLKISAILRGTFTHQPAHAEVLSQPNPAMRDGSGGWVQISGEAMAAMTCHPWCGDDFQDCQDCSGL